MHAHTHTHQPGNKWLAYVHFIFVTLTAIHNSITQEDYKEQELETRDFVLLCFYECGISKIVSAEPCYCELKDERLRKKDEGRRFHLKIGELIKEGSFIYLVGFFSGFLFFWYMLLVY